VSDIYTVLLAAYLLVVTAATVETNNERGDANTRGQMLDIVGKIRRAALLTCLRMSE
jgi:hypothetical protein